MKTTITAILFCSIIVILLFFHSASAHDLTEKKKMEITQEIETIMDHFFNPANLNYETHVGLRANKKGYMYAGDGKIIFTDYESYRSSTEAIFKNIQRFIEVKRLRTFIYVLSMMRQHVLLNLKVNS